MHIYMTAGPMREGGSAGTSVQGPVSHEGGL
jgi:hypothetical protein